MNPELNPIENLLGQLKSTIEERNPANIQGLEQIAKKESEKNNWAYRWLRETIEGSHHCYR